jgi:Tetratricopeptide repeat
VSSVYAQGDLGGARELEERVLEARRRLLGAGHPATLTAMANLAETVQSQGDLGGARELQVQVLEASRVRRDDLSNNKVVRPPASSTRGRRFPRRCVCICIVAHFSGLDQPELRFPGPAGDHKGEPDQNEHQE